MGDTRLRVLLCSEKPTFLFLEPSDTIEDLKKQIRAHLNLVDSAPITVVVGKYRILITDSKELRTEDEIYVQEVETTRHPPRWDIIESYGSDSDPDYLDDEPLTPVFPALSPEQREALPTEFQPDTYFKNERSYVDAVFANHGQAIEVTRAHGWVKRKHESIASAEFYAGVDVQQKEWSFYLFQYAQRDFQQLVDRLKSTEPLTLQLWKLKTGSFALYKLE